MYVYIMYVYIILYIYVYIIHIYNLTYAGKESVDYRCRIIDLLCVFVYLCYLYFIHPLSLVISKNQHI